MNAQHAAAAPERPGLGELGYAVGTAVLALVLTAATLSGRAATVVVLLVLQFAFTLGWLSLLRWATKPPDVAIVMAAGAAADLVLLQDRYTTAGSLAGVIGLSFLATLVRQLPRPDRSHLTDSLAALMSGVAINVAPSVLVTLARTDSSQAAAAAGLFAAAAAALAGRLGDLILVRPRLPGTSTRGWFGLVVAFAAGIGVAVGVSSLVVGGQQLSVGQACEVAGAAVAAAVALDLVLERGSVDRAIAAVAPVAVCGPLFAAAPAVYLVWRIRFG
ncbi:MAG: hypothetical protein ACXV3F_16620 [Frankiaceae bacterium]